MIPIGTFSEPGELSGTEAGGVPPPPQGFKARKPMIGYLGVVYLVKRSRADEAEMEIREAKARNWLW